ncbi:MAG: HAMP domain-containing histidine kinase [Lachnospiraceae bacterium]|nr:HAMP domain-containing histidine kinase [Lachnospiraceae bacterium]
MINTKQKISGKSKYYLQRLGAYILGYSIAWAILFLVIKIISTDIVYGEEELRNKAAVLISAYSFEVMAGIWICVVIAMLVYQWKQILMSLQNQEEEAQRKKNEMLAYLAHDLRTPLTSILGYAHILNEMEPWNTEDARKYVNVILNKSQLLETMLDEFFEVTKLETGNARLDVTEINLAEMLKQLVSEYTPVLSEKELELQCEVAAKAMVLCDDGKMERVFDNLMRNALKYAPAGTAIKVVGKVEKDQFLISFENNSEPIDEEQLENMFEAFVRLNEAGNEIEGAGMGLAIVKEIVELHQGKVWTEYNNGRLRICIQMNIINLS